MASRIRWRFPSPSAPQTRKAIHWSVLAWPLTGVLGALLTLLLIFWAATVVQGAQLRANLAQARQALEAIPTPLPEMRHLSEQLDLTATRHNALRRFLADTSAPNRDWSHVFRTLLDHDPQRVALRTLFQNGDLLSISGLALTRDDVAAYADRLASSGAFEQVDVQSMEDVDERFPLAQPLPATLFPTPVTAVPSVLVDSYEIDDFSAGPITPNEVQQHNFSPVADIDQVTFLGRAGQRYCILALPQSTTVDPILDVFMDGLTYSNDNCASQQTPLQSCLCPTGAVGSPLAALVELQIPATGDRTVQVRVRNQGTYGPEAWYVLSVSLQAQPVTAVIGDIYEPDDIAPRALALSEQQQHSFFPAGDVDRVVFGVQVGRTYEVRTYSLASGVDTVLSVEVGGQNLNNDNVAPGDLSSRVTFVSPVDGQASVLVTNRGQFATDKTYWLTAAQLGPTATPPPGPPPPPPAFCGDPYEPDDAIPRLISPGEQQQRTFCPVGDVDRVRFTALAHHRYRIQTAGLGPGVDTVLQASMGATALVNDDRAPGDPSSLIELTNDTSVDQAVTVIISNKGLFGLERTAVVRVDDLGSASPDAYEPDQTTKRFISVGEVQRHTFFPSGDVDRVVLAAKAGRRYTVLTCGNAYDPLIGGSCLPLAPGVDTVVVVTGPVANCAPLGCQNDDAAPGTSHRGSRVDFDSPGNAEVTITIYNHGSFGPGQEYYVRADEIGVVPSTPAPTPSSTTTPTLAPTETPTPPPTATTTPLPTETPTSTPTPTATPEPTETPTSTATETPTLTAVPSATGASMMRLDPRDGQPPEAAATNAAFEQPGPITTPWRPATEVRIRRWGLQAPNPQATTIVRFVLTCRLKDTAP